MGFSILIVDDEPDVGELFRQRFVVRPVKGGMSCIMLPRGTRRWIGSRVRSSPRYSRFSPTSMCLAWMGSPYWVKSDSGSQTWPVMIVTAYGADQRRRQASENGAAEFLLSRSTLIT